MRTSLALLALLAFAGCTAGGIPGPGDGGSPSSDGGAGDGGCAPVPCPSSSVWSAASCSCVPANGSCDSIRASVQGWLDSHTSCQSDADCTIVYSGCGLPAACGAYVNRSAAGPTLMSLEQQWKDSGCEMPCGLDCVNRPPAACIAGTCQASPPPTGRKGAIGDPCTAGADCASGDCITEQEDPHFVGGYCTARDCNHNGPGCPGGSACQWVPTLHGGQGQFVCLADCGTNGQPGNGCRQGYLCCGSGVPGDCIPSNEPIACSAGGGSGGGGF